LAVVVSGTEGYAEEAHTLVESYERIPFAKLHEEVLHLIPSIPCRALDIGSGTGRDAAALAELGHDVVAVEPTEPFRSTAAQLHPSARIEYLDDSLPNLASLAEREDKFDLVMLTAVWMHLDKAQRQKAMKAIASLMCAGGVLILSLRYGPVPPGRRMFNVSAEETSGFAQDEGLALVLELENQPSFFGRPGVSRTRLVFSKPGGVA
jgi:SAM-dependent methyltransferase